MDFDEDNSKELWEWQKEEYCLERDTNTSHCLWDDLEQKEDGLLYMLGEQTPIKDCADLGHLISDNGDGESKGVDERRECSQLKRRRMLQYNSSDTDVSISDELLASEFMKSNIREDSLMKDETNDNLQWILGLSDSQEGLDQSSECWLASCFNESETHVSSDQMNASNTPSNHADASERCNVPRQMKTLKLPVTISITPCNKLRGTQADQECFSPPHVSLFSDGRMLFISTRKQDLPIDSTEAGFLCCIPLCAHKTLWSPGDTTLKDINQRIHAPFLLKQEESMGRTLRSATQLLPFLESPSL